jgi:hypothetical protein
MNPQYITLDLKIEAIEGKQMPDEDTILHYLIEHLHDFTINGAAVVDTVHITKLNGKPTNQQ